MTVQETIQKLAHLHSLSSGADDSVFTQEQKAWIDNLHREEFGAPVRTCSCKDRYTDAVISLYHKLKTLQKMTTERQYILKRGHLIWIGTEVYTTNNLTDDKASEYLKMHPDARNLFERVPEPKATEAKIKPAVTPKAPTAKKNTSKATKAAKTAQK